MKKDILMHNGRACFAAAALWAASIAVVTPSFAADPAPVDTARTAEQAVAAEAAKVAQIANEQLAKTSAAITPAPAADDIRNTLIAVTEAAVTKGGFKDVVKRFVDADRARLAPYTSSDEYAKLDGRIESFRKDWKSKYGVEFGLPKDSQNVLGDTFGRISQGEIGQAVTVAGKEVPSNEPVLAAGTTDSLKKSGVANTDPNSAKMGGGDTNKDVGRNIATVLIPARPQMPEIAVPMIHELPNSWQIDLPDNVDGQKLHDNLLKQLTLVDEDRANWPADSYEAYRAVARHVMAAIMDSQSTR
jgi:hypothetical protein